MPTLYFVINRRSDERTAKAEARRERIAAGDRADDDHAADKFGRDQFAPV
jgi:hypothetical protein